MIVDYGKSRRLYRNGFTLIELIVVIFVVSLVLAVSLPSFTYIGVNTLKSDARRVASILRYLNETAITTKEKLYLRIIFKDRLFVYNDGEGEKREIFRDLSGVELQSKGKVGDGEVTIFFGTSGAFESFRIYLKEGKDIWTIALNNLSGRVSVVKDEK